MLNPSRNFLFSSALVFMFAFASQAQKTPPGGGGNNGNGGTGDPSDRMEQQRTQQYDQMQQQLDLYNQQKILGRSGTGAPELLAIETQRRREAAEKARLNQIMRENFRKHYRILRDNTDKLIQSTAELQSYAAGNPGPALSREMLTKSAQMEKLAHEIRTAIVGRKVPKMQNSKAAPPATQEDAQHLFGLRVKALSLMAANLKQGMDKYLAENNEQSVSVASLQKAADKTQIDPQLETIWKSAARLERISHDLRTAAKLAPSPSPDGNRK